MGEYLKVAKKNDLSEDSGILVEVKGKKIALFCTAEGYHAIADACPHKGGPLSEGELEGSDVVCPWHGATFNIKTGEVLSPPASTRVAAYTVRVSGGNIEIEA